MMPLPRTKEECESKDTSSSAEPLNLETQKVEEILKAFRLVLENLVPGAAISYPSNVHRSSIGDSPRLPNGDASGMRQGTKCPASVKAPVGYFLALASRNRNRKTLTLHKGRNSETSSASGKENEETDLEVALEESLSRIKLQEILEEKNAKFFKRANERRKHLALVREVRRKRALITRNWIAKYGIKDMSILESALPPKVPPLMSSKEMRRRTEKKFVSLPENLEKKLKEKTELDKETTRQMSSYFLRKLKSQGVLKGKVKLNRSVIQNSTPTHTIPKKNPIKFYFCCCRSCYSTLGDVLITKTKTNSN